MFGYSYFFSFQQKYCLEIGEILVGRKICNYDGDHILVINFKKVKITQDKSVRLVLFTESTNGWDHEVFEDFEIVHDRQLKFKISVRNFSVQEGILFAFINDPDFGLRSLELGRAEECQKLKILQHDENCPICQSECTQLDFKSQVVRKRKISSVSSTSKKSKESTTSDDAAESPSQDMDLPILKNLEDYLDHDGFEKPQPNNTSFWKFFKYTKYAVFFALLSMSFMYW